jgi:Mg2+/citrate symporter
MLLHINKWAYKWAVAYPKLAASKLAQAIAYVVGGSLFGYIGMFIAILNWDDAMAFHADVFYWGTFLLLTLLMASFVVRPPRTKKAASSSKTE